MKFWSKIKSFFKKKPEYDIYQLRVPKNWHSSWSLNGIPYRITMSELINSFTYIYAPYVPLQINKTSIDSIQIYDEEQ